ncbi:MAG: nicotinate phosphoribosyltransferase [Anaerolineales bacterium]|nr:nicotinate phosphoribosyltransferase [Anaerolineales bacterium]
MNTRQRRIAEGALFTDQYQLTMAQLYYRFGLHETPAQFDHFFRSYPEYGMHKAGFCINAGLDTLLDWIREARFGDEEINLLRSQTGQSGERLFKDDFLTWLQNNGSFETLNLRSIPEGRVIHPNVPVNIVQGPLALAQILETPLLNQLNYQILIATKAARIRQSGNCQLLMEFGMRRGQGKGVNEGARAALIGGADFTSNTGISHVLGFPPKGTHAHSLVQAFLALGQTELDAFRAYADVYPDDCLLLVDTIDTLESGIPNAITVFEELKRKGHKPIGIRLDSGDLAHLSIHACQMLDQSGFPEVSIVLSNQLDELVIWQIIRQIREEAPQYGLDPDQVIKRLAYGVGTRLITSAGNCALDGVYKMVAIRKDQQWKPAIKISENPDKIPNPGNKHVWRIYDERGYATADLLSLSDEELKKQDPIVLRHPINPHQYRKIPASEITRIEPLLVDVLLDGEMVHQAPSIEEMREVRQKDLEQFDPGVRRIMNPHIYHVSLTQKLWDLKQELIRETLANGGSNHILP